MYNKYYEQIEKTRFDDEELDFVSKIRAYTKWISTAKHEIINLQSVEEITINHYQIDKIEEILNPVNGKKIIDVDGFSSYNYIVKYHNKNNNHTPKLMRKIVTRESFDNVRLDSETMFAKWDFLGDVYSNFFTVIKAPDDWFYLLWIKNQIINLDSPNHGQLGKIIFDKVHTSTKCYKCDGFTGLLKLIKDIVDDYWEGKKEKAKQ